MSFLNYYFYSIPDQDIDGDSFLQLSSLSKNKLLKELKCELTYGAYNRLRKILKQAVGMCLAILIKKGVGMSLVIPIKQAVGMCL